MSESLLNVCTYEKVDLYNTKWIGEYTSYSDSMNGELHFDKNGSATFSFVGNESHSKDKSGSYVMNISEYHEYSGYIYLNGVKWINKPNDNQWDFNKLVGSVSENYIVGAVINENDNSFVGAFEFKRMIQENK